MSLHEGKLESAKDKYLAACEAEAAKKKAAAEPGEKVEKNQKRRK